MKKLVLVIISFCTVSMVSLTFAQSDKKNTIGVHIAPNYWPISREGWQQSISFGLDYTRQLSKRWFISGGIEEIGLFSKTQVVTNSGILSIPVQAKFNLNNHFYFNLGPSLDVQHLKYLYGDKYNIEFGIGWRLGAGYEHEFNNGITLSLNPFMKGSSILTYFRDAATGGFFGVNLQIGYKF